MSKYQSVFLRFIKAFVAGGVASLMAVPALTGLHLSDLKTWGVVAASAFLAGGIMGVEKLFNWEVVQ